MKLLFICIALSISASGFSQQEDPKAKKKALNTSNNFTYEANKDLAENDFVEAEANYRRAISKNGENATAKYNMGNAYYKEDNLDEASIRYKQASEVAQTKTEKHKAYHNIGNVAMKNKAYDKAVDAYKEALRNNPDDDETRYNLALAKELLKKQQEEQKNDQNKDDKDKNQQDQDQQDKKDDQGEQEDKNEDKSKDGDQQKEEENKEGKGDEEENKKDQGKEKEEQDKSQPRPSQLSPQQIKNILEAMNNEEKKVQEKIKAKKVKGVPVKSEKDW